LAVIALLGFVFVYRYYRNSTASLPNDGEIRIRTGSQNDIIDPRGHTWLSDRWFRKGRQAATENNGRTVSSAGSLAGFMRQGDFDYDIPLQQGSYELRLYFASDYPNDLRASKMVDFTVLSNGRQILGAREPLVLQGGGDQVTIRVFRDMRPGTDGKLHLSFRSGQDTAFVSGIELTPGRPGKLLPIRILARASPYTTATGEEWGPEQYISGGQAVARNELVQGSLDPNLFSGERYGTFTYAIPLAPGLYQVTLYFAETWFGTGRPSGGGVGSRRFDVYGNGVPLLENFDIFKEAGGPYRQVTRVFHRLEPDGGGYLRFSFVPRANHACVNALEVIDETQ
jgi:hypothetical protein